MNDSWLGFGCLGAVCLAPIVTLVVGFLIGRNKLPWSVKIERNQGEKYAVEDEFLKRL